MSLTSVEKQTTKLSQIVFHLLHVEIEKTTPNHRGR